jgi:hypothetical protein
MWTRSLPIKTRIAQFCWKQMVRKDQENKPVHFFITNQVEKGNVQIEHCGTDNMVGDFFTKPLQGKKFQSFRINILGH